MEREAYKRLVNFVRQSLTDNSVVSKQPFLDFVREQSEYSEDDVDALITANINRKVNHAIGRVRNADGNRILFNAAGSVINAETCDDPLLLDAIAGPMRKNHSRLGENLNTVEERKREIEGQLSLFEQEAE